MSGRREAGFAGLPELVAALVLLGLLLPLLGIGLDNTWQLFESLTMRAATDTQGVLGLSAAEAQLQGAQPLGYCVTAADETVATVGSDPGASLEVPLAGCSQTSLGPPPPNGAPDWAGYVSALPDPSTDSCGPAELGVGALVAASATCVGFFSYDDETSGSPGSGAGALSDSGPFTPPELTYLWRCVGPCPGSGGTGGLWLTAYQPTGGYTNAGCPSPDAACNDPDWSTATATQRYIGTLVGSGPVFSFRDTADRVIAEDDAITPPTVDPKTLATVELVTVSVDGLGLGGASAVAVTGNVFQSSTNGNA